MPVSHRPALRRFRFLLPSLGVALLVLCLAQPSAATPADKSVCEQWAAVASAEFGVPERLMRAIATVETGRAMEAGGAISPWPWSVNIEGKGRWFRSVHEATAFVRAAHAKGAEQIDVGCFQLNTKWHGRAFGSVEAMIDPAQNARYAARFLTHLHAEFGNWTDAAAAYHSRTPEIGQAYLAHLQTALATLPEPLLRDVPDSLPAPQVARAASAVTGLGALLPPSPGGVALNNQRPRGGGDGRGGLLFVGR